MCRASDRLKIFALGCVVAAGSYGAAFLQSFGFSSSAFSRLSDVMLDDEPDCNFEADGSECEYIDFCSAGASSGLNAAAKVVGSILVTMLGMLFI